MMDMNEATRLLSAAMAVERWWLGEGKYSCHEYACYDEPSAISGIRSVLADIAAHAMVTNMTSSDVAEACSGTPEPFPDTPFNREMMAKMREGIKAGLTESSPASAKTPTIETRYIVRMGDGSFFGKDGKVMVFDDKSEAMLVVAIYDDDIDLGDDDGSDSKPDPEKASRHP